MRPSKKEKSKEKKDNPLTKTWFPGLNILESAEYESGESPSGNMDVNQTELPGAKYAGSDLKTEAIEGILKELHKITPKDFIRVAANIINESFKANTSLKEDVKLVTDSTDGIFGYWNSYKNNVLNDYLENTTLLQYIANVNHQHFADLKLIYNSFKEEESSGAEKVSTSLLIFLITYELNRLLDNPINLEDITYETAQSIALDNKGDIIKTFEGLFSPSYEEKSSESYNKSEVEKEEKVEFAREGGFNKEEEQNLPLTVTQSEIKKSEETKARELSIVIEEDELKNTMESGLVNEVKTEKKPEQSVLTEQGLLEEISKAREEMRVLLTKAQEEIINIPASGDETDLVGKSEEFSSEQS